MDSLSHRVLIDSSRSASRSGSDNESVHSEEDQAVRAAAQKQLGNYAKLIEPRQNIRFTRECADLSKDIDATDAIKNGCRYMATKVENCVGRFFAYIAAFFAAIFGHAIGKMSELELRQRELTAAVSKTKFDDPKADKSEYSAALHAYSEAAFDALIKKEGPDFLVNGDMESFFTGLLSALDEDLKERGVLPTARMRMAIDLHKDFVGQVQNRNWKSGHFENAVKGMIVAKVLNGEYEEEDVEGVADTILDQELGMNNALLHYLVKQDIERTGEDIDVEDRDDASKASRLDDYAGRLSENLGVKENREDIRKLVGLREGFGKLVQSLSPQATQERVQGVLQSISFAPNDEDGDELEAVGSQEKRRELQQAVEELGNEPVAGDVAEEAQQAYDQWKVSVEAQVDGRDVDAQRLHLTQQIAGRQQAVHDLAQPIRVLIGQINGDPAQLAGKDLANYPALAALRDQFVVEDQQHEQQVMVPLRGQQIDAEADDAAEQLQAKQQQIRQAKAARLQEKRDALAPVITALGAVATKLESHADIVDGDRAQYTNNDAVAAAYQQLQQATQALAQFEQAQVAKQAELRQQVLEEKQEAYRQRKREAEERVEQLDDKVEALAAEFNGVVPRIQGDYDLQGDNFMGFDDEADVGISAGRMRRLADQPFSVFGNEQVQKSKHERRVEASHSLLASAFDEEEDQSPRLRDPRLDRRDSADSLAADDE